MRGWAEFGRRAYDVFSRLDKRKGVTGAMGSRNCMSSVLDLLVLGCVVSPT